MIIIKEKVKDLPTLIFLMIFNFRAGTGWNMVLIWNTGQTGPGSCESFGSGWAAGPYGVVGLVGLVSRVGLVSGVGLVGLLG